MAALAFLFDNIIFPSSMPLNPLLQAGTRLAGWGPVCLRSYSWILVDPRHPQGTGLLIPKGALGFCQLVLPA